MASFDITCLFINIPINETVDIITNELFSTCQCFNEFTRQEFTQFLNLAVKDFHFLFNENFYDQVDGVAFASPLGLLFANIFLSFHE